MRVISPFPPSLQRRALFGVDWVPRIAVNAIAPRSSMTLPMYRGDVAGAIVFFVSDQAGLVTGHVLAVDGGWAAW